MEKAIFPEQFNKLDYFDRIILGIIIFDLRFNVTNIKSEFGFITMDINCDLGEGMPDDEKIMALIDSCNIACGGHAGDEKSMKRTLELADINGVHVGAHPSYEDKVNFGRKRVQVPLDDLRLQLIGQIDTLNKLAKDKGQQLHHVKAHGALYNESAHSIDTANALIQAVLFFKQDLCIFVPYGSEIHRMVKEEGIKHWVEVFADRNYDSEMKLVSRDRSNALILDPIEIRDRVKRIIEEGVVDTVDGDQIQVDFDTICIHGDHPRAYDILKELNDLKS